MTTIKYAAVVGALLAGFSSTLGCAELCQLLDPPANDNSSNSANENGDSANENAANDNGADVVRIPAGLYAGTVNREIEYTRTDGVEPEPPVADTLEKEVWFGEAGVPLDDGEPVSVGNSFVDPDGLDGASVGVNSVEIADGSVSISFGASRMLPPGTYSGRITGTQTYSLQADGSVSYRHDNHYTISHIGTGDSILVRTATVTGVLSRNSP